MNKLKALRANRQKQGFTLVELLLVIAIIGILSGIILVGVGFYRKNARITKVMAELGGQLQNIAMCFSDDGKIGELRKGGNICSGKNGYGKWPNLPGDWVYANSEFKSSSNWYFSAKSNDDKAVICCNSTYSRCGEIEGGGCNINTEIK